MHSANLSLNGHSERDPAGALAGPSRRIDLILEARKRLGTVLDPILALIGARPWIEDAVGSPGAAQRQGHWQFARWLAQDRRVHTVYYPGLEQHPDYAIARKQMRGSGGMVCADVGGGRRACGAVLRFRWEVFKRAASLGGVESLCSLPVLTSQRATTLSELKCSASRRPPRGCRCSRKTRRI